MKTPKAILVAGLYLCLPFFGRAQNQAVSFERIDMPVSESDTAVATKFALLFADRLVKAHFYQDWPTYLNLSQNSEIKYYGGKDGFRQHVINYYFRHEPKADEKPEKLKMITMMNDKDTWQCVIEKVRETWLNDRKAKVTTYLVGESVDGGMNWKFIDVSHNSLPNVIHVMPTIFGKMVIPEDQLKYEDGGL